jgi:hypothetical protein
LAEGLLDEHSDTVVAGEVEDVGFLGPVERAERVVAGAHHVGADPMKQVQPAAGLRALRVVGVRPLGGELVGCSHPDRGDLALLAQLVHHADRGGQEFVVVPEVGAVQRVQVQMVGA